MWPKTTWVSPGNLSDKANLGNNTQGKKNILHFYICMFTLSKKYVWRCMYTFFTVSNMNLQATNSYNFHIITIVFHQLDDPHSAGMLHCCIKVPNDCWALANPLFQNIWMWEMYGNVPQHEILFVAFLRDLKGPHSAGIEKIIWNSYIILINLISNIMCTSIRF